MTGYFDYEFMRKDYYKTFKSKYDSRGYEVRQEINDGKDETGEDAIFVLLRKWVNYADEES